jgi:iron complex outermembrane receptor protein
MARLSFIAALLGAAPLLDLATPAQAQDRSADNAVTQAEDAFGFAVGRESIGIYSGGNARGFSPSSAGNVRIEGLYFDSLADIPDLLRDQIQVHVGLSAQGYPFSAPSGVVDMSLRHPGFDKPGASAVFNGDSWGTIGAELTASAPLSSNLALGIGADLGSTHYSDGTRNVLTNDLALSLRWRPAPGIELMPFWTRYRDVDDQVGEFYVPAGAYLPPVPPANLYPGPRWAAYNLVNATEGLLASARLGPRWLVRLGVFRSVADQITGYTDIVSGILPDGGATRQIYADPRQNSTSNSGELRLTHDIPDGPRLHTFHLSLRERDNHRQYDGSDEVDFGATRIGVIDTTPRPAFQFGPVSRIHIRQDTLGLAYDGRWKGLGELGLSLAKARYRKTTDIPGPNADSLTIRASADPWLCDATLALTPTSRLTLYAGYARGLEESGIAPANAANRNAPLPAILTSQKDAGIRYALGHGLKAVVGVFDLRRPYFGFDATQLYRQVGTTRSRGMEFSLTGPLTKRLNLLTGGYILDPRVARDAGAIGPIGPRPVGIYGHYLTASLNWRTPLRGLALDGGINHRAAAPGTTDNAVWAGEHTGLNLGMHYNFTAAGKSATLRVQGSNLLNTRGFNIAGPGIYQAIGGRGVSGYLAVDL